MYSTFSIKKLLAFTPILIAIGISVFFFFYISPDELIAYIGLENAYVMMFAFAALAGAMTFNTVPYYSLLLVLANAGVDPFFLGLSSALGVMCGDSISYFIGKQGATVIPEKLRRLFMYVNTFAIAHPRTFPLICFAYGSLSPLSNDFITISAGMAKISYLRVMIPLALGNIVFNISLAYLSIYAYDIVQAVFV